jgi:Transposase DDE domain
MTAKLSSEDGKACHAKRKETVEPMFGQIKDGRGVQQFLRRGRGGMGAAVRHPQPAQVVAAHRHPTGHQSGDHLSHALGEGAATAGHPLSAATASSSGREASATCAARLSATRWYASTR